ncbi:MAG TPA: DapH/DapD/GlmU-related protein [Myxococcaceae bacterium]|nr:DapH/DapD/GlmU-related protein [Myxococcaceae bacterium]
MPLPISSPLSRLRARISRLTARPRRVVRTELGSLHPRLQLVDLAVRALPPLAFPYLRTALYRLGGISVGARSLLAGRLQLIGPGDIGRRLKIGTGCWVNAPVFADLTGEIRIGDGVTLGHHLILVTANHAVGTSSRRAGPSRAASIVIGDGAWIGAAVTILPGVSIGPGAIVGAGSVVTADIPADTLAVGNPARIVRRLDENGPPRRSAPQAEEPPRALEA